MLPSAEENSHRFPWVIWGAETEVSQVCSALQSKCGSGKPWSCEIVLFYSWTIFPAGNLLTIQLLWILQ